MVPPTYNICSNSGSPDELNDTARSWANPWVELEG
jgi:hypothetical protein